MPERSPLASLVLDATAPLAIAVAVDYTFGEPPPGMHPVVWMGKSIEIYRRHRPRGSAATEFLSGAAATLAVSTAAWLFGVCMDCVSGRIPRPLRWIWRGFWLKSVLSARALEEAARRCGASLERGDIDQARTDLEWLVSRDRSRLDPSEVAAAAIESVAENTSDSIIAPLLAYAFLGLPGAFAYRAINTLDAMIGYRGEYEYAGKAAAKLDDAANFLPSRCTGLLMCLASGQRRRAASEVMLGDHALTASPNAGWPMSAAAGSLGISLGKLGEYSLNSQAPPPSAPHIPKVIKLMRGVVVGGVLFASIVGIGRALVEDRR